jgi:cyanuric acid amidohydrolase
MRNPGRIGGHAREERPVKRPMAGMMVFPMTSPTDTSGLVSALREGRIDPDSIVAMIGKSEGTGLADDPLRDLAEGSLRHVLAEWRGCPREEVDSHVSIVMSGGCYGVISPHVTVVTVDWRDAVAGSLNEPRLVIGRSWSDSFAPEEIGRMGQIRRVAEAVRAAMADAGLANTSDVKAVLVKGPALSTESVRDAKGRGKTVVSEELSVGRDSVMSYSNDASALGVALALGEVNEAQLSDAVVRREWNLFSSVAMTSCEAGRDRADVVLMGNRKGSLSDLRIGNGITRDLLDLSGIQTALRTAGLEFGELPSHDDQARIVQVFAKLAIPDGDELRGRYITIQQDDQIHRTAKIIGGVLISCVTGEPMSFVSGGERNTHQGPPGGNPVAAVVRCGSS